jgi:signal transduction histidine kinase
MTGPPDFFRPRGPRRPEEDVAFRARRRVRRLRQELLVRAVVALLIIAFDELAGRLAGHQPNVEVLAMALLALVLNVPYYLAGRAQSGFRAQAYARMLIDVAMVTAGLYGAGGLAAAPYVSIYTIIVVYAGTVLSSAACLLGTATATVAFLGIAVGQEAGWLPLTAPVPRGSWTVAIFNLLVVNVVAGLTALLARAYRQNRLRLAVLYEDLERAYDEASRLNAELQRGARLLVLGEVVTGVAHEIGNALQSALLPIELVRRKVSSVVPEVLRHLEQIEYGCTTAIGIVRNVLQTARQSANEHLPVSLAEMARRTLELKGYSLRRDGIAVRLDFPPDFPAVVGPPFRLQQVLLNLISNAQDALANGTRTRSIAIVGSTDGERAVVEVRDTGPGIPADALPRLFEPFYTTKSDGTGLGLPISADIVRSLGGDLTARNAPEGGAVFRLSLPVQRPGAAAAAGRPGGESPGEA